MGAVASKFKAAKDIIIDKIQKLKNGKDKNEESEHVTKKNDGDAKDESREKSAKSENSVTSNGHANGHTNGNVQGYANLDNDSDKPKTKPSKWQGLRNFVQRNNNKTHQNDHIGGSTNANRSPAVQRKGPAKLWHKFKDFVKSKRKPPKEESPAQKAVRERMKAKRQMKINAAKANAKRKLMSCYAGITLFWNSIKLVISRLLYIVHALLLIWTVTAVLGNWYWAVGPWCVTILIETFYCVFFRKGVEWKWFQPCILLYLLVALPSVWLLELERTSQVQISHNETSVILGDLLAQTDGTGKTSLFGLKLSHTFWTLLLEQSMMVLIIIARWLMPKGNMTRDQLSALLLYYLGTASDLVDFFSVLAEDDIFLLNTIFVYSVLGTWSWSMFQFVFVVTQTTSEDEEGGNKEEGDDDDDEDDDKPMIKPKKTAVDKLLEGAEKKLTRFQRFKEKLGSILESEAWAISISMVFQDGPFAVVRCLCLFYWGIRTYTNYFFTFKNVLIVCLQSYRLVSVYEEFKKNKAKEEEKAELERKTRQIGVTLAAISAFSKGGKKQAAKIEESSEESDESASTVQVTPKVTKKKPIAKPKAKPNAKFLKLTETKPVLAMSVPPPVSKRKPSTVAKAAKPVVKETDDETESSDDDMEENETETETDDGSEESDSETDGQSQASTIQHKVQIHNEQYKTPPKHLRKRSRRDSVASSNVSDVSTLASTTVATSSEEETDDSEMSTPRVKQKAKQFKKSMKRQKSRDIDTIVEMENDSSETEV